MVKSAPGEEVGNPLQTPEHKDFLPSHPISGSFQQISCSVLQPARLTLREQVASLSQQPSDLEILFEGAPNQYAGVSGFVL